MSWDVLIPNEEMEAATSRLLETAALVGADSYQARNAAQGTHCKIGEQGLCCRICSMGPCRITPKSPRGVCGCDADGVVAVSYTHLTLPTKA